MNKEKMKKKLENYGYVFKGERILAGFSKRVKNFSCLGKHFHCNWNEKEQVVGHFYTPITPAEARRLNTVLDPITNEPYVGIAWVKMPWDQFEQKEVAALKVVEATEYRATPQEALEYADDFEEVIEDRNKERAALVKKSEEETPHRNSSDGDLNLDDVPSSEQVDANLDDLPGKDEDPLADMVADAEGKSPVNENMSPERAEWMDKGKKEIHEFITGTLGVEMSWSKAQRMGKDELVEIIVG